MSLFTIKGGASVNAIPQTEVLQFITDLLRVSGIVDITGTMLKCTPGSGLQISVDAGRCYLLESGGDGHPCMNTAAYAVNISANSSGNPRITSIVAYYDAGGTANSDASNIFKIVAVDGTPGASPSAPDNSAIESAIGGSYPYIVLANVTVASGASSFIQNDIADTRPQALFRSDVLNQDKWVVINATGSSTTIDLSLGKKFLINLQHDTTFVLANIPLMGKSFAVRTVQDSGGNRAITWFGNLAWPNNVVPPSTLTGNKADEYAFNMLTVTSDSVFTAEGFQVGSNI